MAGKSTYNTETAEAICLQIVEGKALPEICAAKGMPAVSTVYKWLVENPSFSEQYARARELQAETMADMVVDVAMNSPEKTDPSLIRARMEALKWRAGRLKPAKYGEPNLIRKRADLDFEREMINVTPEETDERPPMDHKQFARVMWYLLNAPPDEVEKLVNEKDDQ